MRRGWLVVGLAVACLGIVLAIVDPVRGGGPNFGSRAPAPSASVAESLAIDDNLGEIIPKPNAGRAPSSAGDRGGSLQSVLFFGICGAMLLIGGLAWREGRRNRARFAAATARPPTPDADRTPEPSSARAPGSADPSGAPPPDRATAGS
jgi:hypothetical protein